MDYYFQAYEQLVRRELSYQIERHRFIEGTETPKKMFILRYFQNLGWLGICFGLFEQESVWSVSDTWLT